MEQLVLAALQLAEGLAILGIGVGLVLVATVLVMILTGGKGPPDCDHFP